MNRYLLTLGRIFIALIFLASGLGKVMDPAGTQAYMAQYGIPLTGLLYLGTVLFELGGGLSLLLGWKTRWGTGALILFLIPATLVFHTNLAEQQQVIHFLKNLAILGGLLLVAARGAGPLSLDARRAATKRKNTVPA